VVAPGCFTVEKNLIPVVSLLMKLCLLTLLAVILGPIAFAAEPQVLLRAHAHNDYEHARPLFDALDQHFGSIEADIHLVDGQLLVAHDRKSVKPERTLEALYLDPLRDRVKQNGGRVYRGGPTITLLVDVKTEAVTTYAALDKVLAKYASMLTVFRDGVAEPGAITVVVSGARAQAAIAAQPLRYAAIDGRIEDLAGKTKSSLVPWVSDNWQKVFTWRWAGPMPDEDREKLKSLVSQAHAQDRRIRFWNTPDTPEAWTLLMDAGVDLINTDHLAELEAFMLARTARPTR
jgi:hypothetical protein